MIALRPYQEKCLYTIKKTFLDGENKQVAVLATGLGKTIIFAHLINDITRYYKKKALILVHREELLHQAKDKLLRVNPDLDIGLEMAEDSIKAQNNHQVIIASVATIGRKDTKRILKFDPDEFCCIVTDEAHHASATTYKNVYRYFGVLKKEEADKSDRDISEILEEEETDWNTKILMLGVTATPSRNDNQGINQIYNKVVFHYDIVKGIESNYLSRIRAFRIDTATDLSEVKQVGGDFSQGELADVVNNPLRNKLVLKAYTERIPNQQALAFAVDVKHTKDLCTTFLSAGIAAHFITGETPKEERQQILRDFSTKKIKVLFNCAVLTEGFDEPNIQAILLTRPTQSGILFQQMVGRGTRIAEGKSHLTLLDFVDNTTKQTLQTTASLIGIPGQLDFQGEDILEAKKKIDELLELAPNLNLRNLDIKKIEMAIAEVDLLSGLEIPNELAELNTELDWQKYSEGKYQLAIPKRHIYIQQEITGEYIVGDGGTDETAGKYTFIDVGTYSTLEEALMYADRYVLQAYPHYANIVSSMSKWRMLPVSAPQVEYLQKLRVNEKIIEQLYNKNGRGKASRLIDKLRNYSTAQRRQKFGRQLSV